VSLQSAAITNNVAATNGGFAGGLFITNSHFITNIVTTGFGSGVDITSGFFDIQNTLFDRNTHRENGAGFVTTQSGNSLIANSLFTGNI
jgi:hypothetical protein